MIKFKALVWHIFIFIILPNLNHPTCFGQDQKAKLDYDSTYYTSYNDDLHIRLYNVYKFNDLLIQDKNDRSNNIIYSPNGNLNVGFGFTYRGLGINIGLNLPAINNDDDIYGKTTKLDMRSYMYGRKYAIDFGLQFYQGFYLKNTIKNIPPFPDTTPPQEIRGDMQVNTIGFTAFKIHNYEKFSFRAAFSQTEVQKKTAGSPIYGPYLNVLHFSADSALIQDGEHGLISNVKDGWYTSTGFSGGYAFSIVLFKQFFITGSAAFGYGLAIGNSTMENIEGNTTEVTIGGGIKVNARSAIGYNNDKTYVGLSIVLESYNINTPDDYLKLYMMGQFRFNIVRRFDWKISPFDWIMDRTPGFK
ncbi:DUF4421 domain-containing protein [Flammeovirga kamogawensis]|uniref:DUF4421 domain-containing protein n=1 Tax=Flammeovirga kamogawensis TaxID=373891 RepID=A0ABX8GW66_9BACT|nr:DUF4421 domain-containing protein [Flammeovirga kamogawensis]MBB6461280.1 hypothetical protein [Flammeovirga kamogawensis]QWG07839.1 DUF4421 domain-containing protein [Flammeovirga kamogawensis]